MASGYRIGYHLSGQSGGGGKDSGPTESLSHCVGEGVRLRVRKGLAQGHTTPSASESRWEWVGEAPLECSFAERQLPSFGHPGLAKLGSMHSWNSQHLSANWMPAGFEAVMY